MSCLGDLERGRGDLWQVDLAGHVRGWIWRVPWQDILAGLLGGSIWRVKLAHSFGGFSKQGETHVVEQEKEIEK